MISREMSAETRRLMERDNSLAVWVVQAEESCDSSGGCVTLLVLTHHCATLPDVHAAFARQRKPDCALYRIGKVELLGEFEVSGFLLVDSGEVGDG